VDKISSVHLLVHSSTSLSFAFERILANGFNSIKSLFSEGGKYSLFPTYFLNPEAGRQKNIYKKKASKFFGVFAKQ
jgi:hypothetical protein